MEVNDTTYFAIFSCLADLKLSHGSPLPDQAFGVDKGALG